MSDCWKEHEQFLRHIDETVEKISGIDSKTDEGNYKKNILELYGQAIKLADLTVNEKNLADLEDIMLHNVFGWLLNLPFSLAKCGYVDEAVYLGKKWAAITESENFLGDAVVILAEAGRRAQTLELIEELKENYFDDIWVQIKTGDAYAALKDLTEAELIYKKALASAEINYDKEGVLERLIPMLIEQGRNTEAEEIEAKVYNSNKDNQQKNNEERYTNTPVSAIHKTGRNEPCLAAAERNIKNAAVKKINLTNEYGIQKKSGIP